MPHLPARVRAHLASPRKLLEGLKALEVGEPSRLATLAVASLSPALWLLGWSASEEGACLWKGDNDHVTGGAAFPTQGSGNLGVGQSFEGDGTSRPWGGCVQARLSWEASGVYEEVCSCKHQFFS